LSRYLHHSLTKILSFQKKEGVVTGKMRATREQWKEKIQWRCHDFSQGDLLGPPALRRRFDNGAAYLAHSPTVVWSFDALGLLPRHARPLP